MSGIDFVLDTNMVIGLLKNLPTAVELATRSNLALDKTAVSQITRIELLGYPALTPEGESAIRSFLADCQVLTVDERIEARTIALRRAGLLKLPDAIVAASALCNGARLLTLDERLARVTEAQGADVR